MDDRFDKFDQPILAFLLVLVTVSFVLPGFVPLAFADVGVRFSWILGGVIVVYGGVRILRAGRIMLPLPLVLLLGWFGWALLGGLVPLSSGSSVRLTEFVLGVLRFGLFVSVVLALTNTEITMGTMSTFLKATIGTAVTVSIYAVYQFFARQIGLPFGYLQMNNPSLTHVVQYGSDYYTAGVFARVSGTFAEPSWLGIYLIDVIVILSVPLLYGQSEKLLFESRRLNIASLSLVSLAFLLAFSLGAYGAITGLTLVFFLLEIKTETVRSRLLQIAAAPVGLFFAFDIVVERGGITAVILQRSLLIVGKIGQSTVGMITTSQPQDRTPSDRGTPTDITPIPADRPTPTPDNRTSELSHSSLGTRAQEVAKGLNAWWTNPITGVGLNNLQFYLPESFDSISFSYARLLAEVGLVGMGLFLGATGSLLYWLYAHASAITQRMGDRSRMAALLLVYLLIGYLFSAVFFGQFYQIRYWVYFGIGTAVMASEGSPYTIEFYSLDGMEWTKSEANL